MTVSQPGRRRAFITGASAGIGAEFAERLAAAGYDLVVVARRAERLAALKERLEPACGVTVEPLVADLAAPDGVAAAEARVAAWQPHLLINNAGFSGYGPFLELDPDTAERVVRIHVLCTARLTRAALPAMVQHGEGAVVNVASLLALSGPLGGFMAGRATYAGAKAFMLAFTQCLADEVADAGVQAMVLLPGVVDTEFHGGRPMRAGIKEMSAADVVTAALAGLARGERVCVPGLEDESLLNGLWQQQGGIMRGGNATGELATRYRV